MVSDAKNKRIEAFSPVGPTGKSISKWGLGKFVQPCGIAVSSNGNCVITDIAECSVSIFEVSFFFYHIKFIEYSLHLWVEKERKKSRVKRKVTRLMHVLIFHPFPSPYPLNLSENLENIYKLFFFFFYILSFIPFTE